MYTAARVHMHIHTTRMHMHVYTLKSNDAYGKCRKPKPHRGIRKTQAAQGQSQAAQGHTQAAQGLTHTADRLD